MYGLLVLRHLSPKGIRRMFTYGFPVALFYRWILRSVWGMFFLVSAVWVFAWYFSDVKPWTPGQLAMWIDELDGSVKGSLLTAMLTVIGFAVAIQTATSAWRMQALDQFNLNLANEIEQFFGEASSLIVDMGLYSSQVIAAQSAIAKEGITENTIFMIERLLDRFSLFVAAREKLARMGIEVHGISGRNSTLLSLIPSAPEYLGEVIVALDKITSVMWAPFVPIHQGERAQKVEHFIRFASFEAFKTLAGSCDSFRPMINGGSGALTGALRTAVIAPNVHTFIFLLKRRSLFEKAFSMLEEARKKL